MTTKPATVTPQKILVWDFPTRVFHWSLALCFAGAMITQEMESLRLIHNTFGYTMLGLIAFRFIWGLIGTRHARFSSFLPRPRQVINYIRGLITRKPIHTVGHNPLGALDVILMMSLVVAVAVSGILLHQGIAEEIFEEVHEAFANLLLIVVGVHILGVLFSSFTHRENLVRSMITGYKIGEPGQGIGHSFWWLGIALVLTIAYFWLMQLGQRLF